jgi:hypothetical protein
MKYRHRVSQVVSKAYLLTTLWLSIRMFTQTRCSAANVAKLPELVPRNVTWASSYVCFRG